MQCKVMEMYACKGHDVMVAKSDRSEARLPGCHAEVDDDAGLVGGSTVHSRSLSVPLSSE